jgi:FkbM family methyltransferase
MNPVLSLAGWLARSIPTPIKRLFYRFDPLAKLIRRILNRLAPRGLTTVEVAAGGLTGARLSLDLQAEKDYWLGTYELNLQAALVELVKPGMVAYDVGANIGYVSLLLARQVGENGRVYAFEALPANLERLRTNLELNGVTDRVQVIPAAVVEDAHAVQFMVGPSGGMGKAQGSAGRKEAIYSQAITVPGLSLDQFVYRAGNPPPQVVKMDIEGGEVLAMPGMRRLLVEQKPLLLLVLHGPEAARAAWDCLAAAGYRIFEMRPGYPRIASLSDLSWKAYVIALHTQ